MQASSDLYDQRAAKVRRGFGTDVRARAAPVGARGGVGAEVVRGRVGARGRPVEHVILLDDRVVALRKTQVLVERRAERAELLHRLDEGAEPL